jgi:hypothetical protein
LKGYVHSGLLNMVWKKYEDPLAGTRLGNQRSSPGRRADLGGLRLWGTRRDSQ